MFYVYILHAAAETDRHNVGVTGDLKDRLARHNGGEVAHTSKYRPWVLDTYVAFADKAKAYAFEKYLKSGSGRAFAKGHF